MSSEKSNKKGAVSPRSEVLRLKKTCIRMSCVERVERIGIGGTGLYCETNHREGKQANSVTKILLAASLCSLFWGCGANAGTPKARPPLDCEIALAPRESTTEIDGEIGRLQQEARRASDPMRSLERLGWMFVEKARQSYDPGFYKLAESCAACMEAKQNGDTAALLIRGHALNSLHRFKEAEAVARELVTRRGLHLDYSLLGDSLMEQGRLGEAVDAYQRMIDLKPGPQSYSRVAHIRWLKGDLAGALEMMKLAAGAITQGESAAWNHTRLGLYEFQAGDAKKALAAINMALEIKPGYAPALLALGRISLAQGRPAEACRHLSRAAHDNPLPEFQWTFAEALRAAGQTETALGVEAEIERRGAATDPRTFSVYLANRREKPELAISLAREELKTRSDVFTLDALAWALAAAGRISEARGLAERAISEGTVDARLFFHAGVIAAMSGEGPNARRWLMRAFSIRQLLLPSERERLIREIARL